jgi:hypothetical protein
MIWISGQIVLGDVLVHLVVLADLVPAMSRRVRKDA